LRPSGYVHSRLPWEHGRGRWLAEERGPTEVRRRPPESFRTGLATRSARGPLKELPLLEANENASSHGRRRPGFLWCSSLVGVSGNTPPLGGAAGGAWRSSSRLPGRRRTGRRCAGRRRGTSAASRPVPFVRKRSHRPGCAPHCRFARESPLPVERVGRILPRGGRCQEGIRVCAGLARRRLSAWKCRISCADWRRGLAPDVRTPDTSESRGEPHT